LWDAAAQMAAGRSHDAPVQRGYYDASPRQIRLCAAMKPHSPSRFVNMFFNNQLIFTENLLFFQQKYLACHHEFIQYNQYYQPVVVLLICCFNQKKAHP
jgi:hypothetical protein